MQEPPKMKIHDLVEGRRTLALDMANNNMIRLTIEGGRNVIHPGVFYLDSEDADYLCSCIRFAKQYLADIKRRSNASSPQT